MKRLLLIPIIAALFALLLASYAKADTFRIDSAQFNDGTMYVGPYHSTITANNVELPIISFCIDYGSHVGFGQSFSIQSINLADYTGPLATEYWQAGWIAMQLLQVTDIPQISAMQTAMWHLTSPGDTSPYLNSTATLVWVTLAQANYQSVAASNFQLYLRNGDGGQNQLSVVPEPGTYALLGIGLLALIGLNLRRARQ